MFLGLMNLFIFSVSTTLKSYTLIIAQHKKYVNTIVLYFFKLGKTARIVYILHFTKLHTIINR